MQVKIIGIFGFYSYGNFGDDLMALLFAKHIAEIGHVPLIFFDGSLPPVSLSQFNLESDISKFVEQSHKIIYGGGGILCKERSINSPVYNGFYNNLFRFVNLAEKSEVPLAAFSIGGQGLGNRVGLHVAVSKLLLSEQLEKASLRLKGDEELLKFIEIPYATAPDIVFNSHTLLNEASKEIVKNSRKVKIGINFFNRKKYYIIRKLLAVVPGLELFDVQTGMKAKQNSSNGSSILYSGDIQNYLQELKGLDLLLTCKLHVGIAAISMGIPAILIFASDKATLCHVEAGVNLLVIKRKRDIWKLFSMLFFKKFESCKIIQFEESVKKLQKDCLNHFHEMDDWISVD